MSTPTPLGAPGEKRLVYHTRSLRAKNQNRLYHNAELCLTQNVCDLRAIKSYFLQASQNNGFVQNMLILNFVCRTRD